MQGLQNFILLKQVKAKINFKNKPQHLDKQVHNIFRLHSASHPASCSEFALLRAAAQSTQGMVTALSSQGLSRQQKKTVHLTAQRITNLWETFGKSAHMHGS